jgi:hypothetical protein
MSAATQAPPASDALTMSGAEVVLRALKDNGVEVIFGYPGGAVLPIYDAIFQQNAIFWCVMNKRRCMRQKAMRVPPVRLAWCW